MNILIIDAGGILTQKQLTYARNRMYFSLVRFESRINGATVHVASNENHDCFRCAINVSVEGAGIVSVRQVGGTTDEAIKRAVTTIESKVARRADWRAWFNSDRIATWVLAVKNFFARRVDRKTSSLPVQKHPALVPIHQSVVSGNTKRLTGPHVQIRSDCAKSYSN